MAFRLTDLGILMLRDRTRARSVLAELYRTHRTHAAVSAATGVAQSTLKRWLGQLEADGGRLQRAVRGSGPGGGRGRRRAA